MGAVYEHIPEESSPETKEKLLRMVAERLLTGYDVIGVAFGEDGDVTIRLAASAPPPKWEVRLVPPALFPPVDAWFGSDAEGLEERIRGQITDVPLEAISWGDADLKRVVEGFCSVRFPGWRTSLMIRAAPDGGASLEISFVPEQPLLLAVSSRISSSSIPVMLHSNLRDDLLKGFAPLIGIPVLWLERHRDDLIALGKEIILEEPIIGRSKVESRIKVETGSVSKMDIALESGRYAAWLWMAVYAGSEGRYPEVGLHFGRRAKPFSGWSVELYTELIMALDNWDLEARFGARWSPWGDVWLGGEWSDADSLWWLRASVEGRPKKPYAWLRYSEQSDINGAIGLRINEHFSIELHYDSRDDDPWNVRALVNL